MGPVCPRYVTYMSQIGPVYVPGMFQVCQMSQLFQASVTVCHYLTSLMVKIHLDHYCLDQILATTKIPGMGKGEEGVKHRENRKKLTKEHLIGCQGVKMFLLKDHFKVSFVLN